jgi:NAD-dependent SIR2 family protein deacetylase
MPIPKDTYSKLLDLVKDKDYFVITTNVDHCFQRAGFDKNRLSIRRAITVCFSAPCPVITRLMTTKKS